MDNNFYAFTGELEPIFSSHLLLQLYLVLIPNILLLKVLRNILTTSFLETTENNFV